MNIHSIALAFRLELDFHALNNEGSGGTNVMEPRRIALGDQEYDGISGEMVRRHVLEGFVRLCQAREIPLFDDSKGLVPNRGKQALIEWVGENIAPQNSKSGSRTFSLEPAHYASATQHLISQCALCDVGGYLIAFESRSDKATGKDGVQGAIDGTLKRDSVFEVGWLISEHPALADYAQHAAYSPNPKDNNLFTQNIRSGVYAGVMRIDVERVGYNDWAWLGAGEHLAEDQRNQRVQALLDAIEQYLVSPSGAKLAGWLPHAGGVCEGILVVSQEGPAPFVSPLRLNTAESKPSIGPNREYRQAIQRLIDKRCNGQKQPVFAAYTFDDMAELAEATQNVRMQIEGSDAGEAG
jgi:CRISPR-associated autoregulator DevR family